MTRRPSRYSAVAIALHWLIAVAILSMIPMGWWMSDAIVEPDSQALAYRVFQIHKSIGFLILALTLLRLVWRLTHRTPGMPAEMKTWETFAARATHAAFYGLMLALPLTGWLYVSAGWAVATDTPLAVATSWFGLFTVPHLPFIGEAAAGLRRAVAWQAMGAHSLMAWGAVVLIALHVGAALKHQFINRDGVLAHMIPALKHGEGRTAPEPKPLLRRTERLVGLGFIAALAVAGGIAAKPAPLAEGAGSEAHAAAASTQAEAPVTPGTATAWTIDQTLKLLHPVMPYITEELWSGRSGGLQGRGSGQDRYGQDRRRDPGRQPDRRRMVRPQRLSDRAVRGGFVQGSGRQPL
mgnify:CR=1 FL=1